MAQRRLEQVSSALGEVLQWKHPADLALTRWARTRPKMGSRDRAEIREAVFDVLRHLRQYRNWAESGVGPSTRRLAILGLSTAIGQESLSLGLTEEERQWLGHIRALNVDGLPVGVRLSLPEWLEERLKEIPDSYKLMAAMNEQALLDLRVNPMKAERDTVLRQLQNGPMARFKPVAMPFSPWGIRIEGRPSVAVWPQYEKGELEIQEEGSQLLTALLEPRRGEMVIDYCAGAGGKSLLLGALMRSTGRLYAFDVSATRLNKAKPRFARAGLSNVVPVVIQEAGDQRVRRLHGKAQRVLVDAPCSGLGTLRRNPDLKWRQHPQALEQYTQMQADILEQAAACVAPGGRLVYATCSFLPEENEQQVQAFLDKHPEFKLLDAREILKDKCPALALEGPYLNLRTDRHQTDCFFGAALERITESA
ncbi:RsmB/NOP family class I SAM-dependent RNA methyltransferase [Alcaligenes faecalis]|jgi:16S rRNA (cytosine967-C5)-methyltransferase|nr:MULTISPECIES: RsmB/NOP family class I SAM-dependent RNA methyltransferase [Alcaligenes]ALO40470.1 rRNA methyltransferase [Alcaligenes faecalis]KVX03889.1 rRNA methyltransferase [Alcaligenes faecalis]MBQ0218192.1 RsmB/NOP family class I SAM-dependent RNA methyltransferase [Alcaligenes faecalis]MBW4789360.1 RsmB/NOP family class I SAM-dependent RNA methyltransferase [Alcaligenes faecalis subsp. faecalis]MBY6311048.1 RsmB/NOP family class I SAM-dependent RNA methyltransferase [Alcaligenes faec